MPMTVNTSLISKLKASKSPPENKAAIKIVCSEKLYHIERFPAKKIIT